MGWGGVALTRGLGGVIGGESGRCAGALWAAPVGPRNWSQKCRLHGFTTCRSAVGSAALFTYALHAKQHMAAHATARQASYPTQICRASHSRFARPSHSYLRPATSSNVVAQPHKLTGG